MKHDDVREIRPGSFEHPGWRTVTVNLAIAFVAENQEAETPRQLREPRKIRAIGHRALRVGGRREIDGDGAREQLFVQCVEVRQKAEAAVAGR